MEHYSKKLIELEGRLLELKKDNERLSHANLKLAEKVNAALEGTGLYVWEHHIPSGRLKIYDQTFGSMCGYQEHEVEATYETWQSNLHPEDKAFVIKAFEDHLSGESDFYSVVYRMLHKNGRDTWVADRGKIIERDELGKPLRVVGTHADITIEKEHELLLAEHANLDPLTSLLNRKALQNKFESNVSTDNYNGGALLFIDLDDFKHINDTYGHKVGDKALLLIADVLTSCSARSSHISRYGGDEFVILNNTTDKEFLSLFASTLLNAFDKTFIIDKKEINITLSIGISIFRRADENFEIICEQADKSMYQVKQSGKNNFAFCDAPPRDI
jgi:diguanylate cyclase (GGDEF)-like protein/PAS domain S-box-containing protein